MSEDGDSEDEGGDEDEVLYEFVATGGKTCERCMALVGGLWPGPPDPPHAHCECEIVPRPAGFHTPRGCGENSWSMDQLPGSETARYDVDGVGGFEWGFLVTVECWDGLSHEFEIWVDMGSERDYADESWYEDMLAFAWSEVYDEAELVAAQACRPCEPPLVS